MFGNCSSLKILDFLNYNKYPKTFFNKDMLQGCNPYLIYCLNLLPINQIDLPLNFTYKCTDICQSNIYGYEYNYTCYKKCPKKTNILFNNSYSCKYLNCENNNSYYNFNQDECIDIIPDGYFLNDSSLNTIDQCHKDCKTCDKKEDINTTNCNSCYEPYFLYLGNCTTSCVNGYYNDSNNNKICYCPNNKCEKCSFESLNNDLCITCNIKNNFYPIYNDSSNKDHFINCYNETFENYILFNNTFYEKCDYYYYFDENNNYKCWEYIPEGFYLKNNTNIKIIEKCDIKCQNCSLESKLNNNFCISCNIKEGYYPIYDDIINKNNSFIDCYNDLTDYFLNNNMYYLKKCNIFELLNSKDDFNTFYNCKYYYYCDSNDNYLCTEENKCPSNLKLIKDKKKCIDNCENDSNNKYEYKNQCYKYCPNNTYISSDNNHLCKKINMN